MTSEGIMTRMKALVAGQPLGTLAGALTALDAKPELDNAERLARGVLIEVICDRCPAADAAFDAWANSETGDRTAVEVITAAVTFAILPFTG